MIKYMYVKEMIMCTKYLHVNVLGSTDLLSSNRVCAMLSASWEVNGTMFIFICRCHLSKAALYSVKMWSHILFNVLAPATMVSSEVVLSLVWRRMCKIGSEGCGTVYPQNSVLGFCINTCRKELPKVWSSSNMEYVLDCSDTTAFDTMYSFCDTWKESIQKIDVSWSVAGRSRRHQTKKSLSL